jgi:hypothetical protein
MNLELIKQLEDLKRELDTKSSELSSLARARKEKFLTDAAREFTEFFTSKGFKVERFRDPLRYLATYGGTSIEITIPSPDENFLMAHSRIDMRAPGGIEHMILINPLGSYPGWRTKVRMAPKSEEEKLRMDIEDTKELLEEVKTQIDTFETTRWGYGLTDEANKTRRDYPQFPTFTELLQHVFQ